MESWWLIMDERQKPSEPDAQLDKEIIDSNLEIEISQDQMIATVNLIPPKSGKHITFEQGVKELEEKGVIYGTDLEKLKHIIEKKVFLTRLKVAEGTQPVHGKDGKVIIHFKTNKSLKPKLSEDGKVDFYNLDMVTNVCKGQLLAEIIFPTNGTPGQTVTGKIVPARNGKQVKLHPVKNVSCSEDGTRLIAEINGQPILSDGKISVLPVLEIKGDVGPATGNINFLGSVFVRGNVKNGYKITAEGDIEIAGTVESAEIVSNGSIKLARGIQGRGRGLLKAGLDVIARYVENTSVEAANNIIAEAAMHSSLFAGKKIILKGKRGLIVGGTCNAGEEVTAKTIGSQMATYTEIEVGVDPKHKRDLQKVTNRLLETETNLTKINQTINTLNKLKNRDLLTADKKLLYKKLINVRETLEVQVEEVIKEKERLETLSAQPSRAKVSASNIVFPGVNIIINNSSVKLRDKVEHATFYNFEGQIKFGPYEG
jgi:uncharacterized protein (DUF342 family)